MKNRNKKKPSARAVAWHESRTTIEQALNDFNTLYNSTKDISFVIRDQNLMAQLTSEELAKVTTASEIVLNTLTDCAARFNAVKADFLKVCETPHDKRSPNDFDIIKVTISTLMQAYNDVVLPQTELVLGLGYEAADRIEAKQSSEKSEDDTNDE